MRVFRLFGNGIALYLFITFGFTWSFWVSKALFVNNVVSQEPFRFLSNHYTLGGWGPLFGVIFIACKLDGLKCLKKIFTQTFDLSFSKKWFVPTFLLFPSIVGIPFLLLGPQKEFVLNPITLFFTLFVILFTSGPLQEEYGWRGVLQTQLEKKFTVLKASMITGVIWGIWHLPLFFIPDQGFYYDRPIWGLILSTTLISILFAWIYNNTHKNILLMLIFHTMWNFSNYIFPTIQSDKSGLMYFVLLGAAVLIVIINDKKMRVQPSNE